MENWRLGMIREENIIGGSITNLIDFGGDKVYCEDCGVLIEKDDWVRLERIGTVKQDGKLPPLTGKVYCYKCDQKKLILGTLARVV